MENKKRIVINLILTLIYAFITFVFVLHHEIWADEAQVWQIVKNLSVFDLSLFKHLVNEGHPAFFYLLVMPFAKLNMSIFIMQILCWLSTVLSVFLLLQYSPFNKITKYSIITSAGFMYFFPVIARSYSILPLLVFLLALIYKERTKHPLLYSVLLALCANTHVIMFGFAAVLGIFFMIENFKNDKKYAFSSLVVILGFVTVVAQLWGSEGANSMINFSLQNIGHSLIIVPLQFFVNALDFNNSILFVINKVSYAPVLYGLYVFVFLGLYIILCCGLWFYDKKIFVVNLSGVLFQFFIYIFAYSALMYPSRIFCAFIITVFCYWIALRQDKQQLPKIFSRSCINAILAIFFLMTCFNGFNYALKDISSNYSSAKETALFIKENIPQDSVLIPTEDGCALGIYYYLPDRKFWSLRRHSYIKYMKWIKEDNDVYEDYYFTKLLNDNIKKYKLKNVYIISSDFMNLHHFEQKMPDKYKRVFSSSKALSLGESFDVYKFEE